MVRIQIVLDATEADGLAELAASELRDPRDQVRLILRRELQRCGLLGIGAQLSESDTIAQVERKVAPFVVSSSEEPEVPKNSGRAGAGRRAQNHGAEPGLE